MKVTYLWKTEYLFTYIKDEPVCRVWKVTYLWKTEYLFTYIKDEPVCRVWSWRTCGKQSTYSHILRMSLFVVCEGDVPVYLFTYIKGWACLSCVKLTYLWKTEYLFTYIKDEPVCRVWRWRTCGKQSTYSHILRMSLFVVCEGDVPVENRVLIHIY